MARKKRAGEDGRSESRLDRRDYLRATGTALVGAVAGAGVTATTARAASPVSGSWEIRNRYIETGSNELGIGCAVTDPDGEGVIEHVYIRSTDSSDKPAIWVDPKQHLGHLTIRNVHIEGHADNAVYAELHEPWGKGGTLTIEDCYFHDNTRGNLRVNGGTEVRNTHIHNTGENFPTRGYLCAGHFSYYEGGGEINMRHCQIDIDGSNVKHGSNSLALMTRGSTSAYGDYGSNIPTVTVSNSQVAGEIRGHEGNITLQNSGRNPTINPPKGVPMTASEAENGTSSATGPTWREVSSGGGSSDSDSSESDQQATVLELVANADAQNAAYEFTVDGTVTKHSVSDGIAAEGNDTLTDNGDGTVTVTGASGNGYGDAYAVEGSITAMRLDKSEWTLRYGGQQTSVADLTATGSDSGTTTDSGSGADSGSASGTGDLPNTLIIDGGGAPNAACTYRFAVSGSAAKSGELGSINVADEVNDGVITGRVIGGKDAYRFSGDITEFAVEGPVGVELDSQS
ncbi:hypothetical protein M0R89_05610 [Halorussus limi]|uniref:Right-handed parallel beta-helix repeat-containing protein n=1 Tax=Halorussus limi TaxID=2938695 RepID=A0A8U0HWS0_9EURY|nr:hypothetical protein [Halorussus limi]UPV75542.1 hypothetical protein M0R89_05610 [Halorussus limi]